MSIASQIRAAVRAAVRERCAQSLIRHADEGGYVAADDGLHALIQSGRYALATDTAGIVDGARIATHALWYTRFHGDPAVSALDETDGLGPDSGQSLADFFARAGVSGLSPAPVRVLPWALRAALDDVDSRIQTRRPLILLPVGGELEDAVLAWASVEPVERALLEAVRLLCRVTVGEP